MQAGAGCIDFCGRWNLWLKKNQFLTSVELHTIVDRLVKQYGQEKDFEEFFSKERINNLNDDSGKKMETLSVGL